MIEDKINNMVGKVWLYKANNHTVESVKITPIKISIILENDVVQYNYSDAKKIFEDFLPTDQIAVKKKEVVMLPVTQTVQESLPELAKTVLSNIEKIKTDKSSISQAKAVNQGITTLISMSVLEIKAQHFLNNK